MKLLSVMISVLTFSGSLAMARQFDGDVPVLKGKLATVSHVEIVAAGHIVDEGDTLKPPYRSVLVASVTYNAICDTPLSFVATEKSNLDFEIYATKSETQGPSYPCDAEYIVTKKVYLAHYLDIHPNATLIKVNGVGVSN